MAILTLADRKSQPGYYPVEPVEPVPSISFTSDGIAFSSAKTPSNIPDTAACWPRGVMSKVRTHLVKGKPVNCDDATAYAAVLSLALSIMQEGVSVKSKIERNYL